MVSGDSPSYWSFGKYIYNRSRVHEGKMYNYMTEKGKFCKFDIQVQEITFGHSDDNHA